MESTAGQFFFRPYSQGRALDIQRFCYKKIVRKDSLHNETDYPVYIVIGPDTVSFRCSAHHSQDANGTPYPSHYGTGHIHDFSFTLNDTNGITEWVSDQDIIDFKFLDPKLYIRQEQTNETSFSNLVHWPLPHRGAVEALLSRRELALDFLFDLFHSNVFSDHPAVHNLRAALLGNPLAHAIVAKGDFYYCQELFENATPRNLSAKIYAWLKSIVKCLTGEKTVAPVSPPKRNYGKNEQHWLRKRLKHSAQTWLGVLRNSEAAKVAAQDMKKDEQWFEDVESEHRRVYYLAASAIPLEESELSSQWLLKRYNLFGAMYRQFLGITFLWQRVLQCILFGGLLFAMGYYTNFSIETGVPGTEASSSVNMKWVLIPWIIIFVIIFFVFSAILERVFSFFLFFFAWLINIASKNITGKNLFKWSRKGGAGTILISVANLLQSLMPKAILISIFAWGWLVDEGRLGIIEERFKTMDSVPMDTLIIVFVSLFFLLSFIFILSRLSPLLLMKNKASKFFRLGRRALFLLIMGFIYSFLIGAAFFIFFQPIKSGPEAFLSIWSTCYGNYQLPLSFALFICSLVCAFIGILIEMSTQNSFGSLLREN